MALQNLVQLHTPTKVIVDLKCFLSVLFLFHKRFFVLIDYWLMRML